MIRNAQNEMDEKNIEPDTTENSFLLRGFALATTEFLNTLSKRFPGCQKVRNATRHLRSMVHPDGSIFSKASDFCHEFVDQTRHCHMEFANRDPRPILENDVGPWLCSLDIARKWPLLQIAARPPLSVIILFLLLFHFPFSFKIKKMCHC